jgi:signal transduction histidine kinase
MINLVGNSIKFCANGTIVIRVRNLTDQYIEISVIDDGVGISKENMSRLFKSFGKLPDADHINDQGVGLGLMISNILATRLSLNPQLQNFDTSNEAGL